MAIASWLFFIKMPKIYSRGKHPFQQWYWENCMSAYRRMTISPYFSSRTKSNSKCIQVFKVKLKLLDEKLRIIFQDIRIGEGSLKGAPVPQEMNKQTTNGTTWNLRALYSRGSSWVKGQSGEREETDSYIGQRAGIQNIQRTGQKPSTVRKQIIQ